MSDPQIELRQAQPYLGIRAAVTHGIRDFADSAFPELFGWLFENGVTPAGPPFLRYHEVDRAGEPLDAEAGVPEITVKDLAERVAKGDDFDVIDVREPQEYAFARLPFTQLLPLGDLPRRLSELDSARDIVVHCRTGKRSAQAVEMLQQAGFRKVWYLKGGIDAWSREVDPGVPRY